MAREDTPNAAAFLGNPATRKLRPYNWFLAIAAIGLSLLVLLCTVGKLSCTGFPFFQTSHWYAGKHEDSPDGQFKAEGLVHSSQGRSWCTMEVVEIATGKRIFYFEQSIGPDDRRPHV